MTSQEYSSLDTLPNDLLQLLVHSLAKLCDISFVMLSNINKFYYNYTTSCAKQLEIKDECC